MVLMTSVDGRDDAGSTLIIAMIVMLLLSTLALAGLARTLSVMTLVGHGQRYDSALALADAGLNDAIYRLREGAVPDAAGWTVPSTPGAFQDVSAGKSFRYRATQTAPDEYLIESVGHQGSIAHGIRAVVKRGPAFSLFSNDDLTIGGTGAGHLGLSLSAVLELGGASTDPIHIGSNSSIQLTSGAAAGNFQHVYGNGTCNVDVSGPCPGEVRHSGTYPLPAPAPTGTTQTDIDACDNMLDLLGNRGVFTGVVNGRAGRPYVCNRNVTIGTMSVTNGPLVIYVMNGSSLDLRTALANAGGKAADLRVYKAGTGSVLLSSSVPAVPQVTFTGYLYAPQSVLTISASQWWKGAIYAKRIEATNTPVLTLTYDRGLDRIAREWEVTRYAEIPSSEANV